MVLGSSILGIFGPWHRHSTSRCARGRHAGIAASPRGVSSYFRIGRALCSATLTNSALPRYSRVLGSQGAKLKFRQERLTMFDRASSRCLSSRRMAVMALALPDGMTSFPGAFSRPRFLLRDVLGNLSASRDSYNDTAAAISGSYKKWYCECKKAITCVLPLPPDRWLPGYYALLPGSVEAMQSTQNGRLGHQSLKSITLQKN